MKVALCLHGYFNNKEDSNSGINGYYYIKKYILNKCEDVDVYVHSWDLEHKHTIMTLYDPIDFVFEKQIEFPKLDQDYFDEGFDRQNTLYRFCSIPATLSFLYSRKKSIELTKNEEYDCVISCRFDLGQRDKFGVWKYYVSRIDFDLNYDMNFLYTSMWDQLNCGYPDQWFYSSQKNMLTLATCYDKCFQYFQKNSKYEQALKFWPDSQQYDLNDFDDPKQFSNEIFSSFKSTNQMSYPKWQVINNHILYKFFCIDTELYNITKYVDGTKNEP